MTKGLKKSIVAFAIAAAIFAAGLAAFATPVAGNVSAESQVVGFFLPPLIEGS